MQAKADGPSPGLPDPIEFHIAAAEGYVFEIPRGGCARRAIVAWPVSRPLHVPSAQEPARGARHGTIPSQAAAFCTVSVGIVIGRVC
jgi:hypothetical protein